MIVIKRSPSLFCFITTVWLLIYEMLYQTMPFARQATYNLGMPSAVASLLYTSRYIRNNVFSHQPMANMQLLFHVAVSIFYHTGTAQQSGMVAYTCRIAKCLSSQASQHGLFFVLLVLFMPSGYCKIFFLALVQSSFWLLIQLFFKVGRPSRLQLYHILLFSSAKSLLWNSQQAQSLGQLAASD